MDATAEPSLPGAKSTRRTCSVTAASVPLRLLYASTAQSLSIPYRDLSYSLVRIRRESLKPGRRREVAVTPRTHRRELLCPLASGARIRESRRTLGEIDERGHLAAGDVCARASQLGLVPRVHARLRIRLRSLSNDLCHDRGDRRCHRLLVHRACPAGVVLTNRGLLYLFA
jgi:hypothetical protein